MKSLLLIDAIEQLAPKNRVVLIPLGQNIGALLYVTMYIGPLSLRQKQQNDHIADQFNFLAKPDDVCFVRE
jgi:hypothetical protein